ncbi:hypothetical protein DFJ73DRAFT_800719 [Zopfochytrium polystomum]|nr:hypothetical protein DFJ73DRAFT_800719 [Zopfochytrium polystomum]
MAFTPTDSPSGQRARSTWSARPVTIKHLLTATPQAGGENSLFELDGNEFSAAVIIGRINKTTTTSTFTAYSIDDGTGQVDVRKWAGKNVGDTYDDVAEEVFSEGIYVKIIGAMRPYQGKMYLQAHTITPVLSIDEISYHMLDAVYAHLYMTHGPPAAPGAGQQQQQQQQQSNYGTGGQALGYNSSAYAPKPSGGMAASGGAGMHSDLDRVSGRVMDLLRNQTVEISGTDVCHALRSFASEAEIRRSLQYLESEGFIFNTGEGGDGAYRALGLMEMETVVRTFFRSYVSHSFFSFFFSLEMQFLHDALPILFDDLCHITRNLEHPPSPSFHSLDDQLGRLVQLADPSLALAHLELLAPLRVQRSEHLWMRLELVLAEGVAGPALDVLAKVVRAKVPRGALQTTEEIEDLRAGGRLRRLLRCGGRGGWR